MPTDIQQLKAYGHMPQVSLNDIRNESARAAVTEELASMLTGRLCGHPDYYDPEIGDADPDDLAKYLGITEKECSYLHEAHGRIGQYNNERWPKDCHATYPGLHAVNFYVEWDTFPRHHMRLCTSSELNQIVEAGVWGMSLEEVQDRYASMPMAKVAFALSDLAYEKVGAKHFYTDTGTGDQVHVNCENIPGGVIGFAYFPNGQCRDHVTMTLDIIQFSLMGLARLICHEAGHNHGEQHQFNGQSTHHSVMSYDPPRLFYGFSTGQPPYDLPRDKSLDSLLEKYGGPLDPDPNPPPPNPDRAVIKGEIYVEGHEQRFIVVPKPRV